MTSYTSELWKPLFSSLRTKSKMTLIALQGYSMFRGAVLCLSEVASVQP